MTDAATRTFIKQTLRAHLPDPSYRFFLFGSRVIGDAHPYSDFDVGIVGKTPAPSMAMDAIKEELEESNLPVRVDVVDFLKIADSFKRVAMQNIIYL